MVYSAQVLEVIVERVEKDQEEQAGLPAELVEEGGHVA